MSYIPNNRVFDLSFVSSFLESQTKVDGVYVVKLVGDLGIVTLQTKPHARKHPTDHIWWPGGKIDVRDTRNRVALTVAECAKREWMEETGTRLTGTVIDFVAGVITSGRDMNATRNAVFLLVKDDNRRYGEGYRTSEGTIEMLSIAAFERWFESALLPPDYSAILAMVLARIRNPVYRVRQAANLIVSPTERGVWPNIKHCNICSVDFSDKNHVVTAQHIYMLQRRIHGENEFHLYCDGNCNKRDISKGVIWPSMKPSASDSCSTWVATQGVMTPGEAAVPLYDVLVWVCRSCGGFGAITGEVGSQKYLAGCGLTTEEPFDGRKRGESPTGSSSEVSQNSGMLKEVEQVRDIMPSKD